MDTEDTEMFPEFKNVVTPYEFCALGENSHRQMTDKIIKVEKALGINDLDSFAPKN